jgi:hypothetical protein
MNFDINNLVEVRFEDDDDFLKIKETLTRMGIGSRRGTQKLYQSCHILHKQGRYYIVHFKELFALDGKFFNMSEEDTGRRNLIANMLEEWGLVELVDPNKSEQPLIPLSKLTIISWADKPNWDMIAKYDIGKKKRVESYV